MPRKSFRTTVELRSGKPLRELLRQMRYERHLTLSQISREIGIPAGTVGVWMVDLGLSRRDMQAEAVESAAS